VCTACWRDAATVVPSDHRAAPLDLLVETVLHLSREQPERQVARYELALEATRQPEIRAVMDHHARQLRLILARMLTQGGIRDAEEASWPVAAMVDGLLRDRVAGLGATLTDAAFEASARTPSRHCSAASASRRTEQRLSARVRWQRRTRRCCPQTPRR
jgi:non-ribosomal peptide synthetase component F